MKWLCCDFVISDCVRVSERMRKWRGSRGKNEWYVGLASKKGVSSNQQLDERLSSIK